MSKILGLSKVAKSSTPFLIDIQLFQLRLSPSKVEKWNTSVKGLLGIAKKLMKFLTIPSKPFHFFALLRDNLN
jgi:hypothetical protein